MTDQDIDIIADRVAAKVLSRIHQPELPELLNMKQVMKITGMGRRKVINYIAQGRIRIASGPGEKYKFRKSEILTL